MEKKIGAVILAAGKGERMGTDVPKQYMKIEGEPMVYKTLWAFASHPKISELILVVDQAHAKEVLKNLAKNKEKLEGKKLNVVQGGSERHFSALKGLMSIDESEYVLIHDAARPFVTKELIDRVIDETLKTGAAVPTVKPKDTIRTAEKTLNRNELYAVQTPQGFKLKTILKAYLDAKENGFVGTDDASYVDEMGEEVSVVEGDYKNIKITTMEDLAVETKIGKGFDVHRFADRKTEPTDGEQGIMLGGIKVPFDKEIEAHSDGDVIIHSIIDALLGAMGLGDIGTLFPDTDPKYKDISSVTLLQVVMVLAINNGYSVGNVDVTLIGEEPKIGSYRESMRMKLSSILGVAPGNVSVKATTTEGMGFTGRGEGLACEAVCTLVK